MGKFAVNSTLRAIVGTVSTLNFFDVMQEGKILLCNLSKPAIGADTSAILGAMLVSQFQLAAMRRGRLHPSKRRPFYLFIDEFQTFQTSAFNEIITESRKYQLCLTLANQKLEDLDQKTRGAVQGVETSIIFRPFDHEAATLARSLPESFSAELLKDLDKLEFVIRVGKSSNTKRRHLEFPPAPPKGLAEEIRKATRAAYPITKGPDFEAGATDDEVSAGPPPG
jgi:Type IV secretion-system coupling protein DNA-binding domain